METEILKIISKYTPYSYKQVKEAYDIIGSYDDLIKAINVSINPGCNCLNEIANLLIIKRQ